MVAVLGGHAGAWYREALEARAIGLHEVAVAGETRTCLSVLDESTGELTELYEAGVRLRDEDWPRVEAALRAALGDGTDGTVVVLAGSLPPGTPVDGYARLARIAADAGARAVVDSDGASLLAALAEAARGSSRSTRPRPRPSPARARGPGTGPPGPRGTCVERGAANAIVTRGVHGAVLATADGTWALGNLPASHRGAVLRGQRRRVPRRVPRRARSWTAAGRGPARSPAPRAPPMRDSPARASWTPPRWTGLAGCATVVPL